MTTHPSGTTVAFTELNSDATLTGNGIGSSLGLALDHANTWSATQTFTPSSNVTVAIVKQASGGPVDVFDIDNNAGSPFFAINSAGDGVVSAFSSAGIIHNDALGLFSSSSVIASDFSAGSANTFMTTDYSGTSVAFVSLAKDATLTGNGVGSNLGIALDHSNTWTNSIIVAPSNASGDVKSLVVQKTAASTPSSDIFVVEGSGGSPTKYLYVDNGGKVNLGSNAGGASVSGTILFNDGSSHTATLGVASQGGNRTYTVPDAGAAADFIVSQSGSTQTIATGNVFVNHNFEVGTNGGSMNGHLQAGGGPCPVWVDALSNATSAARIAAHDISGQVNFVSGVNVVPWAGDQIDLYVNTKFGGGETPVVVVSSNDLNTASLKPYAYYLRNTNPTPDYIVIGTKIAPPPTANPGPGITYTFNYHVISVQ